MSPNEDAGPAVELVRRLGTEIGAGTFIPPEHVEAVIGVDQNDARYSREVIKLRGLLESYLEAKQGRNYMTRMARGGIRILTTSEAAQHGHQSYDARKRGMEYWHHKTQVVVAPHLDELDEQERRRYQEQQHYNARMLLHMKEVEIGSIEE